MENLPFWNWSNDLANKGKNKEDVHGIVFEPNMKIHSSIVEGDCALDVILPIVSEH